MAALGLMPVSSAASSASGGIGTSPGLMPKGGSRPVTSLIS